MKQPKTIEPKRNSFLIPGILLTGLLSFLIHPTVIAGVRLPPLSLFAWIFLAPLLITLSPYCFSKKFLIAFLSGTIGHYGLLFWLVTAMHGFGGLGWGEAFGALTALVLALSAIMAFFLAAAYWAQEQTKFPFGLVLPVFITLRDVVIHHFPFGGYPWGIAPYSQGEWLSSFQWVDHTGVFGLSFFIYGINGLVVDAFSAWRKHHRLAMMPVSVICLSFLLSSFLSQAALRQFETSKQTKGDLTLALIQPNIRQDEKWNPQKAFSVVEELKGLTRQAVTAGAQLILWPETSYPFGFKEQLLKDTKFLNQEIADVPILFGAFIQREDADGRKQFNAVLQSNGQGELIAVYRKMHLVPFGEYLPFARHLKFMESLTQGIGHFNAGTEYTLFNVNGIQIASLICIEDVFPIYARKFSAAGADLLVNYTNDAWYGDSSAQYQHVVYSQFRALENRKPLVRVTNTGISAVIDAKGEVLETLPSFQSGYLLKDLKIEMRKN